jgi:membrane protease YdiL (CAAX protease family)
MTSSPSSITPKSLLILSGISGTLFAISGMDFIGFFVYFFSDSSTMEIYTRSWGNVLLGFLGTFLSLLVIPLLYVKLIRKKPLFEYGTTFGIKKWGFISVALFLLSIPVLYFGSQDQNLINTYPLTKDILVSWPIWLGYELLYISIYYIPYEFFFRGILQLGLSKYWKKWQSILYVTVLTTLLHLTKPITEIVAAAAAGVIFGILAEKTNSWYYPFLMHITVGISTDIFCGLRFLALL